MLFAARRVTPALSSVGCVSVASMVAWLLATQPARAQEGAPPTVDTIIVTGSRVATSELKSINPVTVVTNQAIEASGDLNISNFLRDLPSVGTSGLSSTNSNFLTNDSGVNTINLRNLGDQRTLVLVNGKRYVPGVAGNTEVDFNTIPTDFIDHVEVLTGGASAVYGSDAVAGVVNVIYKTNFTGIELRGQRGATGSDDDARYGGGLLAGSTFDEGRGHFMFDVSWDKDDGLWSRDRKRSAVDQQIEQGALVRPALSTYAPQGRFEYSSLNGTVDKVFTFNPDNTLKDGFGANDGFNRNAFRRLSVPTDRTVIASTLNFDVAEHHQLYSELTYAFSHVKSSIEPLPLASANVPGSVYGTALDGNGDLIAAPITNAYLQTLPALAPVLQDINQYNNAGGHCVGTAATNKAYDCINYFTFRRRLTDDQVRSNENNRQTGRLLLGMKGDVPLGDWKYDVSYSYGRTTDSQVTTGFVNLPNVRQALDSVVDAKGQIVCRDPVSVFQGCVPLNLFGNNSITPAAASYIRGTQTRDAKVQEQIVSVSVNGSLGTLPAGDPQLAIGLEHRKDSSEVIWDALTNAGLNGGNQLPNSSGSITAKEAFAEVQVPILKDLPLASSLDLNAAVRHANYSTVGGVNTYKMGLDWAPIPDVRFRGVYSVAIRAPNIGELFNGAAETFPTGFVDPCDGISAATVTQFPANCTKIPQVATALANGKQFAYSLFDLQTVNGFIFANPKLRQEKAKTTTVGFVLTPRMLPRFSATVDFYDVKVDDAVSVVDLQTEITQCLNTGEFCDAVIRNPITGKLQTVNQQQLNIGAIRTRGVDTTIHYGLDFGNFGTLTAALTETHLIKLEKTVAGNFLNNVGELNDGTNGGRLGAGFRDRGTLNLIYDIGGVEASWRATYMSSINDTNPTPDTPPVSTQFNSVPAYVYHDVQVRYTLPLKSKTHAEVYLGANNVFNKQPPVLPQGMASTNTGAETAADTYDVFGVFWYAGFKVKL